MLNLDLIIHPMEETGIPRLRNHVASYKDCMSIGKFTRKKGEKPENIHFYYDKLIPEAEALKSFKKTELQNNDYIWKELLMQDFGITNENVD